MRHDEHGSGAGIPPYTRTGDDGTTTLGDFTQVVKTDHRLAAYAGCEEANAAVGAALASGDYSDEVITVLTRVQNDLIDVAGDLGTPMKNGDDPQLRADDGYVARVEEACEHFNAGLPVLETFVVPGGTRSSALLYQAGTVVRRAERATWAAAERYADLNVVTGRYLNRLADLLFVLGRVSNVEHGDVTWQPGLTSRVGLLPTGNGGERQE